MITLRKLLMLASFCDGYIISEIMEKIPEIVTEAEKIVSDAYLHGIAEQDAAAIEEERKERRTKRIQKIIDNLALWGQSVAYMNLTGYTLTPPYQHQGAELYTDTDDSRPDSVH